MGRIKQLLVSLRDFFPIHLVFSHFKFNMLVLLYWGFLFSVINGWIGQTFGLEYLFVSPEYMGDTSFMTFFLVGFSTGGFIMAFHTYSYIRLGPKYPFIATLARPFFKFCVNNSFIPLLFIVNLAFNIVMFQKSQELEENIPVAMFGLAFVLGTFLFIILAFIYFFPTNTDLFKLTGKSPEHFASKSSNIKSSIHKKQKWYKQFLGANEDRYFYIGKRFKIKQSRSCKHYDIGVLNDVFSQNHTNASLYEIALLVSFFLIGFFKDYPLFQVPASVSIMMLLTIFLMLISAMFSWFRAWTYPIIIGVLLLVNYLSIETDFFKFQSHAFGLSYSEEALVDFSPKRIRALGLHETNVEKDLKAFETTLNNWKEKTGLEKPKLIIVNASGGGLRSAMWTFAVHQKLDKKSENIFSKHSNMITGASGGMIGAAYYRDILLKEQKGEIESRLSKEYLDNIGKDLLNRISFSVSTNDIFFRFQTVEINGKKYTKDRGYAFEQQLKDNLDGALSGQLGDYFEVERAGEVPTMIFAPTIINDGRRLIISAQHLGFLNANIAAYQPRGLHPEVENVEYLKFFSNNRPHEILFSSVLRMNATFPYIMPMVTMPTKPGMQIMDAGMRDNYGTKLTVQYLVALEDWIQKNTSGIIIVKIRDTKKVLDNEEYSQIGFIDKLLQPFGSMYGNFPRVQDFDQDELLLLKLRNRAFPVDVISFHLRERVEDKIALSWHLTKQEKKKIVEALNSQSNNSEMRRFLRLMSIEDEEE